MKEYIITRPKDIVKVLLLPHKDGSGYSFVNLTKGHICPCIFKTEKEAIQDLENQKQSGNVSNYIRLK